MITHSPVNLGIAEGWWLQYGTLSALQLKLIVWILNSSEISETLGLGITSKLVIQMIGEVGKRQGPCACSKRSIRYWLGLSRVQLFLKADLD